MEELLEASLEILFEVSPEMLLEVLPGRLPRIVSGDARLEVVSGESGVVEVSSWLSLQRSFIVVSPWGC